MGVIQLVLVVIPLAQTSLVNAVALVFTLVETVLIVQVMLTEKRVNLNVNLVVAIHSTR